MRPFYSTWLDDDLRRRWREHAERVAWSHYIADAQWADVERSGRGLTARRPDFFWAETDGEICLTALGVRRQLPVQGRAFWEFNRSPTFVDLGALDEWLTWLVPALGRDAARLRVGPPLPLDEGGDDVETLLERHGFVRRRILGKWGTLRIDLGRSEDELFASLRRQTRRVSSLLVNRSARIFTQVQAARMRSTSQVRS